MATPSTTPRADVFLVDGLDDADETKCSSVLSTPLSEEEGNERWEVDGSAGRKPDRHSRLTWRPR